MRALLTTLLLSLGVAWWLVPSQSQMVHRLLLDQQYEGCAQMLREMGDDVSPAELLSDLKPAQVATLTTLFRLTPHEQLRAIFNASSPPEYTRHLHAMVLSAVRYLDVIQPDDAWLMIAPHLHRLSDKQAAELCTVLAANALSVSKPDLAATIWKTAATQPGASASTADSMALAYQWASRPRDGARELFAWLRQRADRLSYDHLTTLADRCGTLALAGGDPSLALDASLLALRHVETLTRLQIETAWSRASQCSRMAEMRPWVQRYLRTLPPTQSNLAALRRAVSESPDSLKEYQRWLFTASELADWASDFDSAFDHHLRLAAMGRIESLDRVVALSNFLGRDDETAALLALIGDVPQRPKLVLFRAEILASLGEDEAARPLFERWLKSHPDDRDTAYAYACLLEDVGDEDAAMAAFADLLQHHPGDVPTLKKLAENYIRADRPADALKLYAQLREADHDHYTLENYALLAESLEDRVPLLAAQALTARRAGTAEAWLEIASTGRDMDDRDAAIVLLREGLQKLPNSAAMRVGLAELLALEDEEENAVDVLMHPSVKGSYAGISALLALSEHVPDKAALLKFVGNDVEKRFDLAQQTRLDLAVVCYQAGDQDRSEDLFASVPLNADTWHDCAAARFDIGAYDEAARLMKLHLDDKRRATADDWVFLGDIYDLLGRSDDARDAYNFSLTLITTDLPETASREPSSAAVATKPNPTPPP